MRALYCATAVLVSFACANAEESSPPQTLAILFHFKQPYPTRAFKEAQRELRVLTKGAALRLEWHERSGLTAGSSFPNILVLDFLGNCDPRSESEFKGPRDGWLARMHVSNGVVLPFGEVNCDLVRAVMNDGAPKGTPDDLVFGRALARALAHELYHFTTQSSEHETQGLTKPTFSREDLVSDRLTLDRTELDRMSDSFRQ